MQTNLWLEYFFGYDSQVNPGYGIKSQVWIVAILFSSSEKSDVSEMCIMYAF